MQTAKRRAKTEECKSVTTTDLHPVLGNGTTMEWVASFLDIGGSRISFLRVCRKWNAIASKSYISWAPVIVWKRHLPPTSYFIEGRHAAPRPRLFTSPLYVGQSDAGSLFDIDLLFSSNLRCLQIPNVHIYPTTARLLAEKCPDLDELHCSLPRLYPNSGTTCWQWLSQLTRLTKLFVVVSGNTRLQTATVDTIVKSYPLLTALGLVFDPHEQVAWAAICNLIGRIEHLDSLLLGVRNTPNHYENPRARQLTGLLSNRRMLSSLYITELLVIETDPGLPHVFDIPEGKDKEEGDHKVMEIGKVFVDSIGWDGESMVEWCNGETLANLKSLCLRATLNEVIGLKGLFRSLTRAQEDNAGIADIKQLWISGPVTIDCELPTSDAEVDNFLMMWTKINGDEGFEDVRLQNCRFEDAVLLFMVHSLGNSAPLGPSFLDLRGSDATPDLLRSWDRPDSGPSRLWADLDVPRLKMMQRARASSIRPVLGLPTAYECWTRGAEFRSWEDQTPSL